jgi:16S rRNA (uracil1498-N3)-methyltransferase
MAGVERTGLLERADTVGQFVVSSLELPQLSDDDVHHLERVLRVRDGERVCVTDGRGSWLVCLWRSGELVPDGVAGFEPAPGVAVSVGFSLLKGDRNELVVQKLTELGVDVVVPVTCAHTVVKWSAEKALRHHERLQRVAYEAAMQSRRVWLPTVEHVRPVFDAFDAGMSAAHPGGDVVALDRPRVVVGPEGGFSDEELARARSVIDLGPTVLRAETASITLGALLCARRAS